MPQCSTAGDANVAVIKVKYTQSEADTVLGPKGPPGLRGEAGVTEATSVRGFPGPSGVPGPRVDSGPAGPAGSVSQPGPLGPQGLPGSPEPVGATGKYHWLLQVPLLSAVCLSLCLSVRPSINTTRTRMRYSKSL